MRNQLVYGLHTIQALLNNNPEKIRVLFVQTGRDARIQHLIELAKQHGIAVQYISKEKLDNLLEKETAHQGIAADIITAVSYSEIDLKNILANSTKPPFLLILDGVQDPHNLGACLRSANAAGVNAVIVPKNNAADLTPAARKAASGAAETTPLIQVTNLVRALDILKEHGIWIYGADASAEHTIYQNNWQGPVALILGGEGKGLRRLTRENCDGLVKIPMQGTVASLNVSVAAGICLFEVLRQREGLAK
jgi:23S rRNA (guanosine2251-2'-O)-methyltransferase